MLRNISLNRFLVPVFFFYICSLALFLRGVNCFPQPFSKINVKSTQLNATTFFAAMSVTESQANATGAGSTVEISGIVTGSSDTALSSSSTSSDPDSYSVSLGGNCSDYSTSWAQGSTQADATTTGNCTVDGDSNANFQQTTL